MKQKYSAIVFDLGNVLLPIDFNKLKKNLDTYNIGLGERFFNNYKKNIHIHKSFEGGQLSTKDFLETMMVWTENRIHQEEFCNIFSDIFYEDKNVSGLLPLLKENYRLILLSNTNYIHQKYGWEKYKFLLNFEKMILSHEVGIMKPDERIYQALEDFSKLQPEEHLFIDDLQENVEAANKKGWVSIHYTDFNNLEEELKNKGIKYT